MAISGTIRNIFIFILGYLLTFCEAERCSSSSQFYIYCTYGCCGNYYNRYCCSYSTGSVVGAVLGSVLFVAIVVSILACCFCACCPGYRYRSRGTVITTTGPNYQTMPNVAPYPPSTVQYPNNTQPYPPASAPYPSKPAGQYSDPPPAYQ